MSSKSPSQSGSSSGAINSSSSESSNNGFVIAYGSDRKGDETRIPAAKPSIKLETAKVENSCLSSVVRDPKLSATFSQKINSNQTFDGVFANGNSVGGEGYELSTLGYKAPLQCRNQNLNGGRIDKPLVYKKEAPQEINEPRPSQYDFVATPSSKAEVTGVPESGSTNIAQQPLSESATKQVVDPDTPDRIVCTLFNVRVHVQYIKLNTAQQRGLANCLGDSWVLLVGTVSRASARWDGFYVPHSRTRVFLAQRMVRKLRLPTLTTTRRNCSRRTGK